MLVPFKPSRNGREVLLADWRDAEELAAWYMREILQLAEVRLTGSGTDGGIDVVSRDAVAQVKHYSGPVGVPEIQQLKGAGHSHDAALFFALSGFTQQAVAFAQAAGVALFTYTIYGDVKPRNGHSRILIDSVPANVERRAREEAEAAAERAREAEEAAAYWNREIEAALQRRRQVIAALEWHAANARKSISDSFERTKAVQDAVYASDWFRGTHVRQLILTDYASFYSLEAPLHDGDQKREAGPSHLGWLKWLKWLNGGPGEVFLGYEGRKAHVHLPVVRSAVSELLKLQHSIGDIDLLRKMSPGEWVEQLHVWALREAQIQALLKAAVVGEENTTTRAQLNGMVTADVSESPAVTDDILRRWERGSVRNDALNDANACRQVLKLDPMILTRQEGGVKVRSNIQNEYVRRNPQIRHGGISEERRFPLGCTPEIVRQLQRGLRSMEEWGPILELPLSSLLDEFSSWTRRPML